MVKVITSTWNNGNPIMPATVVRAGIFAGEARAYVERYVLGRVMSTSGAKLSYSQTDDEFKLEFTDGTAQYMRVES